MSGVGIRARDEDYERLLEEERLILDSSELIHRLMDEERLSRTALAQRIGKSKGHISQLLDGRRNMTLRTLARLAYALNHRVYLNARPWTAARRARKPIATENLAAYVIQAKSPFAWRAESSSCDRPPGWNGWLSSPEQETPSSERIAAAA
jgi:transcriptional regulator with XRE-family HTH domain